MHQAVLPIFVFFACGLAFGLMLWATGVLANPGRPGRVKQMPYESGMDPLHDARRRFDVRFHLLAIALLVFDVEVLLLYPWAVTVRAEAARASAAAEASVAATAFASALQQPTARPYGFFSREAVFWGGLVFVGLLALGLVYDWKKGILRWR